MPRDQWLMIYCAWCKGYLGERAPDGTLFKDGLKVTAEHPCTYTRTGYSGEEEAKA